jgi:hypothetical protein
MSQALLKKALGYCVCVIQFHAKYHFGNQRKISSKYENNKNLIDKMTRVSYTAKEA